MATDLDLYVAISIDDIIVEELEVEVVVLE